LLSRDDASSNSFNGPPPSVANRICFLNAVSTPKTKSTAITAIAAATAIAAVVHAQELFL
jgi:hypothetical protein